MNKKKINYTQALTELNEIISSLQTDNIDVDEISSKVKRAIELIRLCKGKIRKTELEVKKIVEGFQQEEDDDKVKVEQLEEDEL